MNVVLLGDSIFDNASYVPGGLSVFNDVIVACAVQRGLAVIDLRFICDAPEDYSPLSPIEPSEIGGRKIAGALHRVLTEHDYKTGRTVIFGAQ